MSDTPLARPKLLALFTAIALVALPLALWRDLLDLSDQNLRRQSMRLDAVLDAFNTYYSENVVARVNASEEPSSATHDYHDIDGAIPIPATASIELGNQLAKADGVLAYRFVSDYPFKTREQVTLSDNENRALQRFRDNPDLKEVFYHEEDSLFDHRISLMTPIVMEDSCVACHNAHPESPKTDWVPGDVRGMRVITVEQPLVLNLFAFRWLLAYLIVVGSFGTWFAVNQFRLANRFSEMNSELADSNDFLASISMKLSRYLPPQVYKSIFSGEKEVALTTERKKLTVFFSDIKDFTETTERLQPEELTRLLNEYFTEMSQVADDHGATIDKFIGDAIVAFFGDPETKGTAEDARACVRMAIEMQERLNALADDWRARGIETPFQARIGINTGFCNVGNFGSDSRMDYTIIGAEANLAARLESIAKPGGIVMSYETYALVDGMVEAEPMEPVRFKGIAREVVPYEVKLGRKTTPAPARLSADGSEMRVDLDALDEATRADMIRLLGLKPL